MNFGLKHPAEQLVVIMDRIYRNGMTTTSGGNLSILDDHGDMWITPSGVDKGSLTREDIIRVRPDGTYTGKHVPSVELPFHRKIYEKRPDLKAVIHAHSPSLISFSIVRKIPEIKLIPNVQQVCGEVGLAKYATPGSIELGENIAREFDKGIDTVILENHGVAVGAEDLFKAFMAFETLDFCARLDIDAHALGKPTPLSMKHLAVSLNKQQPDMEEYEHPVITGEEAAAREEMCALIHRAYDLGLFTSTQGTFSQRLPDGSFLITPYLVDRKYMSEEDIVRIENGRRERGKTPSRSVMLHKYIYELHPWLNSVIIAHPPNIMAFAVTKEEFDSRIIPETYIMLRNVKKIPFGSSILQPKMTAETFSESAPAVIVQNDCVITTGTSLLNAFDRLEVLEYSAKAIIASGSIGKIVRIGEEEITRIDEVFKLVR